MDFGIPITGNDSCVDTVRALHQTIVALRTALEKSRNEILELKSKNWSEHSVEDTIKNLSVENHVLRQKFVSKQPVKKELTKRENKQNRSKNKEGKQKTKVEKVQEASDPVPQEDKYINVQVTSESITDTQKISKSLENVAFLHLKPTKFNNQLSKSKTVCFSNIFDGENQISTANSLHLNLTQSNIVVNKNKDLCDLNIEKRETDNYKTKEKKLLKSNRNLQFEEEVIGDSLIASRRGSISDFKSEDHTHINELEKFAKCINESKKLLERCHSKRDEINIKSKETGKNKSRDKSPTKQQRKREGTFTKEKKVAAEQNNVGIASTSKETRRPSSLLGEQLELVLTQKYPEQNQVNDIIKDYDYKNNVSVVKQEVLIQEEKANNLCQEKSDKQLLKSAEEPPISEGNFKTIKKDQLKIINLESKDRGLKKEDCVENTKEAIKEDVKDNQLEVCSIKKTEKAETAEEIEAEKHIKDSENKIKTKVNEKQEIISNEINTAEDVKVIENPSEVQEIQQQNNSQNPENSNPVLTIDNNADLLTSKSSEKDSDSTIKTSETSSNSSTQKNVEISVKIYKGSKKPIEIDIQTKKKRHSKKKTSNKTDMNNKSQNSSIDKEFIESIPTVNVNRLSTNEIRRNVDNATADNIVGNLLQNDIEQEVDDIELIFTTDDTKETDFKEELVPIDTYAETQLLQCPLSDYDEKLSAEASDRELEDDVFNDNFENENQENCNFQSQTYDFRRESSQIYNSKSDNSINHEDKSLKSYYSYQDSSFENKSLEKDESFDRFEEKTRIIETDISKIGILDADYNLGRRNTCPNPIQYRPIMHREALGRGLSSRKCRPILAHSNVVRKESGAQTDISALPGSSWRSESSLGHKVKVGENFTTLPSKFPHPGSRLRLSEKTVEARRVLLSDIGFTSMVPELSRSADHLCPPVVRGPTVTSYGQFLRTTDLYSPAYTSQKFVWTTTTPSDGSHSQSRYSSQYPLSSPPAPTRRCSAPVSPSKKTTVMKSTPSRVRFANGSLPELRGDWTATVDSGESTDSLVEEAEHFLRRSIDCLAPVYFRSDNAKATGVRRASAPEPTRDNVPPQGWQPFLPRIPRDLRLDYWVKVISPEGRVRGGRVRYVGPLMNQSEAFVGVQLSTPDGHSDGTHNNRRYFNCEPYHGLFVPFKKIIMGWRP